MAARSKLSTQRTGQIQEQAVELSQREMQRKVKISQNRKTAHTKDPGVPICGDKTAINVTVRCRSRSKQETQEDHAVILRTDGIKGKTVEVSMGSLSNKTYNFDRVFSPAADQRTVYEDTVLPMVDELLLGYNCTIFAYGQTGTGKTYTMFGEMAEEFGLLSDNAGIIPRTLYTLFDKLKGKDSTVKCTFIELYNEALRDLLSDEEDTKLQLFGGERNGANGSLSVKGMQESYIDSLSAGIQLLQMGSQKRQVAATKCNDLSSRSHTIFTINVLTRTSEESITSGKLNLVDLAGSENIQRSGAENKRAVEAGQINKSLLTLGRVINALVDKSSHIPYRESKLTRLLQDSLGGQTKTCIIATVSPCQSSQEETLSTLDYAFRAKNIHNRPQINSPVPKDTLLSELALEIESLKRNLRATRHRNGIYMTSDTHEEMTKEIESRRIINEEQKQRIQALESGLQHKAEELLSLTHQLRKLDFDHKEAQSKLSQLNDTLNKAQKSVAEVSDVTEKVETRLKNFQAHQTRLLRDFSTNLSQFLENEVMAAQRNQALLYNTLHTVESVGVGSKSQLLKGETEEAFDELKQISKRVRVMVSETSNELSQAITRISEGLQGELMKCNNQFNMAYSTLDKDVQCTFQTIVKHIEEQNIEISDLRHRLQDANSRMIEMNHKTLLDVSQLLEEERTNAKAERDKFLTQIGAIYDLSFQQRWDRLQGNYGVICSDISSTGDLMNSFTAHSQIDECIIKQKQLAGELVDLRDYLKVRMKQDKETFDEQYLSVQQAAGSAKKNLQQSIDNYEEGLSGQLDLWTQKLEKTQSQNNQLSESCIGDFNTLETTVQQSYLMVKDRLGTVLESSGKFQKDMALHSDTMEQPITALEKEICEPLSHLRMKVQSCLLPTSASLRQASDCTTASPHHDNKASLTSLVHEGPREQDFHDRPEETQSNQEGVSHWVPGSLVEQQCLEVTYDDSEQPRLKRRRL